MLYFRTLSYSYIHHKTHVVSFHVLVFQWKADTKFCPPVKTRCKLVAGESHVKISLGKLHILILLGYRPLWLYKSGIPTHSASFKPDKSLYGVKSTEVNTVSLEEDDLYGRILVLLLLQLIF